MLYHYGCNESPNCDRRSSPPRGCCAPFALHDLGQESSDEHIEPLYRTQEYRSPTLAGQSRSRPAAQRLPLWKMIRRGCKSRVAYAAAWYRHVLKTRSVDCTRARMCRCAIAALEIPFGGSLDHNQFALEALGSRHQSLPIDPQKAVVGARCHFAPLLAVWRPALSSREPGRANIAHEFMHDVSQPGWKRPMWRRTVIAICFACCCGAGGAVAQGMSDSETPSFSTEDLQLIKRNAALVALMDRDPRLARRALDMLANSIAIAARSAERSVIDQGAGKSAAKNKGKRKPDAEEALDPKHNPDLDDLIRTSPEAAHDLFQLIKQAGRPVKAVPKR